MSIILAARRYAEMKQAGLTIEQISRKTGVDQEAIRERLQLLTLTAEEQDKVKDNKLSLAQALKLCEQRQREEDRLKASDGAPAPAYEAG